MSLPTRVARLAPGARLATTASVGQSASAAGVAPASAVAPRRTAWPLLGLSELPSPTPAQAALASRIFGSGARFLGDFDAVAAELARSPPPPPGPDGAGSPPWAEVAFVGRSNVGKSSLLNALLGERRARAPLVPVSRHPGLTNAPDYYAVGLAPRPALVLVDTPGYGFSSRGRGASDAWMQTLARFLLARGASGGLARVTLLVDARVGLQPLDDDVLAQLDAARLPAHVVLTKADALRGGALEAVANRTLEAIARRRMPFPAVHAVSARTGEGLRALREAIVQTARLGR